MSAVYSAFLWIKLALIWGDKQTESPPKINVSRVLSEPSMNAEESNMSGVHHHTIQFCMRREMGSSFQPLE